MNKVDPVWSLDSVLRDYHPHPSWCGWFTKAYTDATESTDPATRLTGWRTAAVIFGDMHVPVFCLFVCHHGQTFEPPDSTRFLGHIDLCLWELGLATPARPTEWDSIPSGDVGKPEGFHRDLDGVNAWFAEQLHPFNGNVERAAMFAMQLTAARFGLLRGPVDPSIAQVLDVSLWERVGPVNA